MKSDPFAPATSPNHIKNLTRGPAADIVEMTELDHDELIELADTYQTTSEFEARKEPDLDELRRRETLVQEFRAELAEHGEAENPTLIDLTEVEHVWRELDPENADAPHGWLDTSSDPVVGEYATDGPDTDTDDGDEQEEAEKPPSGRRGARKPRKQAKGAPALGDALKALQEDQGSK